MCSHRYDWVLSIIHLSNSSNANRWFDNDCWRSLFFLSDGKYDTCNNETDELLKTQIGGVDQHSCIHNKTVESNTSCGSSDYNLFYCKNFRNGSKYEGR